MYASVAIGPLTLIFSMAPPRTVSTMSPYGTPVSQQFAHDGREATQVAVLW